MPTARLLSVLALVALAACSKLGWGPDETERALPFRADVAVSDDHQHMQVTVEAPPGVTVEDARESARYQATRNCLKWYGDTDAEWQIDPATNDWAYTRTPEGMVFSARCVGR